MHTNKAIYARCIYIKDTISMATNNGTKQCLLGQNNVAIGASVSCGMCFIFTVQVYLEIKKYSCLKKKDHFVNTMTSHRMTCSLCVVCVSDGPAHRRGLPTAVLPPGGTNGVAGLALPRQRVPGTRLEALPRPPPLVRLLRVSCSTYRVRSSTSSSHGLL